MEKFPITPETSLWLVRIMDSRNRPGWKGPWKIVWSSLSWERNTRWGYLAPCPIAPWKPSVMGTPPHPWGGCSVNDWSHLKFNFLYWDETSANATCTSYPLSSSCGFWWSESLHPLCRCPVSRIAMRLPLGLLFSREKRLNSFSQRRPNSFDS